MKKNEFPATDAQKYELMVIVNPEIGADATAKQLDEIKEMLVLSKGEKPQIFFEDVWGLRDLAYKIKRHDRGFYAVYDFIMDPSLVRELDTNLRLETNILRHMIVKLPFAYEPKTLAQLEEEKVIEESEEKKPAKKTRGKSVAEAAPKQEVKEEIKEKPRPEKAEKETPKKPEKEEKPKKAAAKKEQKETTLEDVDAKLRSIIENPDINF
jgi:small subunit ribosomal protein S6